MATPEIREDCASAFIDLLQKLGRKHDLNNGDVMELIMYIAGVSHNMIAQEMNDDHYTASEATVADMFRHYSRELRKATDKLAR